MGHYRYSTAFSHLILAGVGIYCLTITRGDALGFLHASFGIITLNSLVGIWRWGNPDHGNKSNKFYRFTTFCQGIFALPCITTSIWLLHGYMWEAAYAHTAASLIPLAAYLTDHQRWRDTVNVIVVINMVSLTAISFVEQNYFGIATTVSYALNHFVIKEEGDWDDVPLLDLFNYGLCFFAFFSLKTLAAAAI